MYNERNNMSDRIASIVKLAVWASNIGIIVSLGFIVRAFIGVSLESALLVVALYTIIAVIYAAIPLTVYSESRKIRQGKQTDRGLLSHVIRLSIGGVWWGVIGLMGLIFSMQGNTSGTGNSYNIALLASPFIITGVMYAIVVVRGLMVRLNPEE